MKTHGAIRRCTAIAGALCAAGLITAGPALAATSVSVRVEGLTRTLLPAKTITAPASGSVTEGGTPAGQCPADTAAGALNVATHQKWGGSYSKGLGIEVNSILGTSYSYAQGDYWSIFVDNHYAEKGICDLTLHNHEQLLFAPYPSKGKTFPIVLKAPARASVGTPFRVRAYYYPGQGSATKPIKGVSLSGASGTTNAQGVATVTATRAGTLRLVGSAKGYIRSAVDSVTVGS
jgi:hypothetical protein